MGANNGYCDELRDMRRLFDVKLMSSKFPRSYKYPNSSDRQGHAYTWKYVTTHFFDTGFSGLCTIVSAAAHVLCPEYTELDYEFVCLRTCEQAMLHLQPTREDGG